MGKRYEQSFNRRGNMKDQYIKRYASSSKSGNCKLKPQWDSI